MTLSAETAGGPEERPGKALLVLRVLLGVALVPGILIAAVAAVSSLVWGADALDPWVSVLADMLAVPAETLPLLAAVVVAIPGLMLAGLLARPRWWLPAVLPFLLGCILWYVVMRDLSAGYADPYDMQVLVVLHVVGTGAALIFGWLGTHLARSSGGRQTVIALGIPWTGGMCLTGVGTSEIWGDPAVAFWLFAVGLEFGLAVVALVGYWARENRELLSVSWMVWSFAALAAVAVGRGLAAAGALAWYTPLPALVVGGALFSGLGFTAAGLKSSRTSGRLTQARAMLALACAASVASVVAGSRLFPHPVRSDEATPAYVRLSVAQGVSLPVEFRANRMLRVARTPDGLEEAPWVLSALEEPPFETFPAIDVPVPPDELPPGCAGLRARFRLYAFGSAGLGGRHWGRSAAIDNTMCFLDLAYLWHDAAGSEWAYWVPVGVLSPAASLDVSETVAIPHFGPGLPQLNVSVDLEREEADHVGFALSLTNEDLSIEDVQRDGESIHASLQVLDAGGNIVASTQGTLDDLGFT
jgi:hypothetical protein